MKKQLLPRSADYAPFHYALLNFRHADPHVISLTHDVLHRGAFIRIPLERRTQKDLDKQRRRYDRLPLARTSLRGREETRKEVFAEGPEERVVLFTLSTACKRQRRGATNRRASNPCGLGMTQNAKRRGENGYTFAAASKSAKEKYRSENRLV